MVRTWLLFVHSEFTSDIISSIATNVSPSQNYSFTMNSGHRREINPKKDLRSLFLTIRNINDKNRADQGN